MANFLITGIAGFIGSSIARALVARGETVRGLDDLSSGKLENLEPIMDRLDFREGSVADPATVNEACRDIDYVFHEAAIPSVPISVRDPIGTNKVNLDGTLNVLLGARQSGVRRVVFAGSSAVYGDSPTLPKKEEMSPDTISPYAVAKLASEHYLQSFYRVYGLETVSLRYFNVFGPRQDPSSQYSGVLARFISQMLDRETPTIFGDGETTRDFVYIDNVVDANLRACRAPAHEVAGRVFNIATGLSISINQAYEALRAVIGYRGVIVYGPEREGDVRHSVADISRARRTLGYDPQVTFNEGLSRTVAWYRTQRIATLAATR